ncbi:hypothetical protein PVAG01_08461 [Phlyctema vagabunda]|uniref:Uncharacterized protein n=1 Tax=Phlyctema vagabunda TaxID=108571 RepID=A0ABR4P9V5_9HELO
MTTLPYQVAIAMGTCTGTRGMLGFVINGELVGTYNGWDSYPARPGLGQRVVDFIQTLSPDDCQKMDKLVGEITWVGEDDKVSTELQKYYLEVGLAYSYATPDCLETWGTMLYKMQNGSALSAIQSGALKHLTSRAGYLQDALHCEWAYFIDFKNQMVDIWSFSEHVELVSFDTLKGDQDYMRKLSELPSRFKITESPDFPIQL